ncbi:hypothetical protein [Cellulomonas sp. ES6]|uniref:hypothetical protein n=1 Tax=Cellulomonas sp. ES6 TaxID=3039384 RepID=UPI0024B753D4|nr:hypothetical protein [Cellulomonas sp. ES6]WHP19023.1 hypothetical protein P9841_07920 [Cellulomonas sp. ES6]
MALLSTASARRVLIKELGARLVEVGCVRFAGRRIGWGLPDAARPNAGTGVWLQIAGWSRAYDLEGVPATMASAVRCQVGRGDFAPDMYEQIVTRPGSMPSILHIVEGSARRALAEHAWSVSFARVYGRDIRSEVDWLFTQWVEADDAFFPLSDPSDVEFWVDSVWPDLRDYRVDMPGRSPVVGP